MNRNEPKKGKEFYDLLVESDEFTSELGRMTLASGMMEAEIVNYYRSKGHNFDPLTSTLGFLINKGNQHGLLKTNEIVALEMLKKQRNEFTHRIYSLFKGLIQEERLPTTGLLDSDVSTYIDYAWQLRKNLEGMTEVFINKNNNI